MSFALLYEPLETPLADDAGKGSGPLADKRGHDHPRKGDDNLVLRRVAQERGRLRAAFFEIVCSWVVETSRRPSPPRQDPA